MNLRKDFSLNKRLESDTIFIDDLTLCKFLLMNDSNYYWFLLVPRINNIKELYDLSKKDRIQLDFETVEVAKFIKLSFKPEKINIASLGNIVSQFHTHIIGRFVDDPAWPGAVWGKVGFNQYKSKELNSIINLSRSFSKTLKN
jgi:diadenosine tetraphosphate (Ap4A) HIT family hydrolase